MAITLGQTSGTLSVSTTVAATLWSTADLVTWQSEGPVSPGSPAIVVIGSAGPMRFYQIRP